MSKILRRPMFRGGPVSSYGTGIASGLADGGRVGLQSGGAPFNVNPGARTVVPTQSTMQTGASLLDRARNIPYLGRLIPSAGGRLAAMSPFGLAALGGIGIGAAAPTASPMSQFLGGAAGVAGIAGKLGLFG